MTVGKGFFDEVRVSLFGGKLDDTQVMAMTAIIDAWGQLAPATMPVDAALDGLAYALATAFHETGGSLAPVSENLRYTSAVRIRTVWPSRFKNEAAAAPFVNQPEKLANRVYGGRLGNGNEASGDGWRYRGRGLSQATGRAMYALFGKLLGLDLISQPELALQLSVSAKILVSGLVRGLFTGKKLADFFTHEHLDPVGARACVNADVSANGARVASYWRHFRAALTAETLAGPAPVDVGPIIAPARPQPDDPGVLPGDKPIFAPTLWQRIVGGILDLALLLLRKGK